MSAREERRRLLNEEEITYRLSVSPTRNRLIDEGANYVLVERLFREGFAAGETMQWSQMLDLTVEQFAEAKRQLGK